MKMNFNKQFENIKKKVIPAVAGTMAILTPLSIDAKVGTHDPLEGKFKIENARKVATAPLGYTFAGQKDGKNYYVKTIESSHNVKPHHPEGHIKHASTGPIKHTSHPTHTKTESVDIVYTESESKTPEKPHNEPDPFAAFATRGESLFDANKHIMGELFYPIRDTKSIRNAGMVNTGDGDQDVLIRLHNDEGLTGEFIVLKASKLQNFYGTGHEADTPELANSLREEAKQYTKTYIKNKATYTFTPEELAKGTTLNNGNDIVQNK